MGKMRKPKPARRTAALPKHRAYDLEVCILSGQMTDSFVKKNRSICRTIRIRGDETLERLHEAIFDAFERFDQHMYEFQVGGKGPMDPRARRFVLPTALEVDLDDRAAGVVTTTTLDSLELKQDDAFGYWFDFGDDWWHQVTVVAIRESEPQDRRPRVIASTGASPPQYPDEEEE